MRRSIKGILIGLTITILVVGIVFTIIWASNVGKLGNGGSVAMAILIGIVGSLVLACIPFAFYAIIDGQDTRAEQMNRSLQAENVQIQNLQQQNQQQQQIIQQLHQQSLQIQKQAEEWLKMQQSIRRPMLPPQAGLEGTIEDMPLRAPALEPPAEPAPVKVAPPSQVQVAPPPQVQMAPPPQAQMTPPPQVQMAPPPQMQMTPPPQAQMAPPPQMQMTPPPQAQMTPPPVQAMQQMTPPPAATPVQPIPQMATPSAQPKADDYSAPAETVPLRSNMAAPGKQARESLQQALDRPETTVLTSELYASMKPKTDEWEMTSNGMPSMVKEAKEAKEEKEWQCPICFSTVPAGSIRCDVCGYDKSTAEQEKMKKAAAREAAKAGAKGPAKRSGGPAGGAEKECEYCHKMIKADATYCRHCGAYV